MKNENKIKFICGVTLYNPDDSIEGKLELYAERFDKLLIFDNSGFEHTYPVLSKKNVNYINKYDNLGLPYAFNHFLELSNENSFLCLLDQDSIFTEKDIICMEEKILDLVANSIEFGAIGPEIIYQNTKKYSNKISLIDREYIITSGTFLNVRILKKIDIKYDEKYFIDRAEVDLCRQLNIHGIKILTYTGSKLYQELGELDKNGVLNHNSIRHYYMFRNRLYYNNKFYTGFTKLSRNLIGSVRHLVIILREQNRCSKVKALMYGMLDYLKGEMGRYDYK